ncbi:MAG: hypothetical protein U0U69_10470 [Acidimicrobiia bacterium]
MQDPEAGAPGKDEDPLDVDVAVSVDLGDGEAATAEDGGEAADPDGATDADDGPEPPPSGEVSRFWDRRRPWLRPGTRCASLAVWPPSTERRVRAADGGRHLLDGSPS